MRIDNRVIHAPTVLLSLESNNSEIKMLFIFAETPPVTPRSLPDTILRKSLPGTRCENKHVCVLSGVGETLAAPFISPKGSLPCEKTTAPRVRVSISAVRLGGRESQHVYSLLPSDRLLLFKQCR